MSTLRIKLDGRYYDLTSHKLIDSLTKEVLVDQSLLQDQVDLMEIANGGEVSIGLVNKEDACKVLRLLRPKGVKWVTRIEDGVKVGQWDGLRDYKVMTHHGQFEVVFVPAMKIDGAWVDGDIRCKYVGPELLGF